VVPKTPSVTNESPVAERKNAPQSLGGASLDFWGRDLEVNRTNELWDPLLKVINLPQIMGRAEDHG